MDNVSVIKHYNKPMNENVFEYNTKIKKFPDGSGKLKYHTFSSIKGLYRKKGQGSSKSPTTEEDRKKDNLYNSKQRLIDLVYCNSIEEPWEYFVTLTFNPDKVDSFSYSEVVQAMHKWLDNMKHQNKQLKYILVPELHKSGRIHIHGLFKKCPNLKLVDSGKRKNGLIIYNLTNYKYGYTTVSKVQDQEAVSVYVSKYMTKDLIKISGKNTYWCSKHLLRPQIEYAHFNEESLNFYIDKYEIKDLYQNERTTSISYKIIYIMLT